MNKISIVFAFSVALLLFSSAGVTGDPVLIPEMLIPWDIGADQVVLEWKPVTDPDFDHYEIHFSTDGDFLPDDPTLYYTDTEQYRDGDPDRNKNITIDLNPSTTYYFFVASVNTSGTKYREEYPVQATTKTCNDGGTRDCGPGSDLGICEFGDEECVNGVWSGLCEGAVYPLTDEWGMPIENCNGLDDDCDGRTDEDNYLEWYDNPDWPNGVTPMSRACNSTPIMGECGSGEQYCIGGGWESGCRDETGPQPEICDGLDNDCDGTVDNVNGGDSIDSTKCACYDRANFPGSLLETCNGIDDNCDGTVDNVNGGDSIDSTKCACYDSENQPGDLQETCNGIDDDCNADDFSNPYMGIDDPWQQGGDNVNESNYLGRGCGFGNCSGGEYECDQYHSGTICSTIWGSENLAVEEICDGLDNDCDLSIDEGCNCPLGVEQDCGLNAGICEYGKQLCIQENGESRWGECAGGIPPETEKCGDGLDNDCSGVIDDIPWCGCYGGALPSMEACNGVDDDCDGTIDDVDGFTSVEETKCTCFGGLIRKGEREEKCNGIDNDCNGVIDDPWRQGGSEAGEHRYLGLGCGYGNSSCSGGEYVCSKDGNDMVCNTMSSEGAGESRDLREEERCNGIDDDCDGTIDNVKGLTSVEETHCRCYGGGEGSEEACNEVDDDCDEKIDDGISCACLDGQTSSCGSNIGTCSLGERLCVNGQWGECEGETTPQEEVCNMRDDNCNGLVDDVGEGYSVEGTQCGCYNGRKPSVEKCDGIDNDCNGRVDDDIDCSCEGGEARPCGSNVGICSPGQRTCVEGKWGECEGGVLPEIEACNGKDNNCDGIIDNVNGGNSIGSTKCACYNRFAMAGTQDELCNGIDDDCDGTIDEGCRERREPEHCGNRIRDGDEEGTDCGGSCDTPCAEELPAINTWLIIFAFLVGVIAIFGVFFSSFLKKEKTKSLFDRTGK